MPKPDASPAALELCSALEPAFTSGDEDRNFIALRICMALVAGKLDLLWSYLIDDETDLPAWSVIFNPETAPAETLPYLAQFGGAVLTPEMTEEARRKAIQTPEAFSRGRLASLEAVAKRRLTGTKTILVTERYTGNAWRLRIESLESETPDPEGTLADILTYQKPIGVVLFFNQRAAWTWGEVKAEKATYPTWLSVKKAFSTWLDFRTHKP